MLKIVFSLSLSRRMLQIDTEGVTMI